MATFRKSTPVIVAVRSGYYENERFPSLEADRVRPPQIEEKVLPQQAALQEMPGSAHRVRKAERNGIRGKHLVKVFKRARNS